MGSLTSRPSIPSYTQPQIVRLPTQPITTPVTTPSTSSSENPDAISIEETATTTRQQSLLGRERSRFGTVLTSFRGLLGVSEANAAPRKTLLGE